MRCPSVDDITAQVLALLPRGRAWQTHDRMPSQDSSTIYRYWRSFSEVLAFLTRRLCDLRLEFWCATHSETHDLWMREYGLPDSCDPFPDLCAKVAALGGARCEYYAEIAARAGWSIDCVTSNTDCGGAAGNFQAGCDVTGGVIGGAMIMIIVRLHESPAYLAPLTSGPFAGNLQVGRGLDCDPDISPLKCILDRVVHAHIEIEYRTIEG